MNQCFCRSLAAAVVMSAISAPVAVNAEQVNQLEASLRAGDDAEADFDPLRESDLGSSEAEVLTPLHLQTLQPEHLEDYAIAPLATQVQPLATEPAPLQSLQPEPLKDYATSPLARRHVKPLAKDSATLSPLQALQPEPAAGYMASPLGGQIKSLDSQVELFMTVRPDQTVPSSEAEALALSPSTLVQVFPHPLDTNQAATLYVSDIPVLTFVGQELEALAGKGYDESADNLNVSSAPPSEQAIAIANRIDSFYRSEGNPETIMVRWDEDREEYVIDVADEALVVINEAVMLPDTTHDFAEDALQATNRLRRLLGGAEPLTEIEGQPEPLTESAPELAVDSNWDVTTIFTGQASWYGPGFHGRRTASGEVFNQEAMTAAHRTLPFGTLVRVTNLSNDDEVIVRINDRGPFSHGRILDLSAAAAREVGLYHAGIGQIRLEVLSDDWNAGQ